MLPWCRVPKPGHDRVSGESNHTNTAEAVSLAAPLVWLMAQQHSLSIAAWQASFATKDVKKNLLARQQETRRLLSMQPCHYMAWQSKVGPHLLLEGHSPFCGLDIWKDCQEWPHKVQRPARTERTECQQLKRRRRGLVCDMHLHAVSPPMGNALSRPSLMSSRTHALPGKGQHIRSD